MIPADIIQALDGERIRQGMNRYELSRKCGYNRDTWQECTARGSTSMATFLRICDTLDIDICLVDRNGNNIL